MRCIFCSNNKTDVVDSRMAEDGSIRRRRSCPGCSQRFTSYETAELELFVLKKDGRKVAFAVAKLKRSIDKAGKDAKISLSRRRELVKEIAEPVIKAAKKRKLVKSSELRRAILGKLDRKSKKVSAAWRRHDRRIKK